MMNIYQRINKIREAVHYAKKDKRVGGGEGGYMAVTHDAVTAVVRPFMVEHGVVIIVQLLSSKVVLTGTTTSKGVPYIRYEAIYDVGFVNCDDQQDRIMMRIEAHAIDQGDKAPGKAISYAVKYATLKLFSIETGEDDESRAEQYADKGKGKGKFERPEKFSERGSSPGGSVIDTLSDDRRAYVVALAKQINDAMDSGAIADAYGLASRLSDTEEKVAAWLLIKDSAYRSALKRYGASIKTAWGEKNDAKPE
jgi:hypothetical protein